MTGVNNGMVHDADFTEEDLERIIPDKHARDSFRHLMGHMTSDKAAMIALKGHLVIEGKLTTAIEKFVHHPNYLNDARLTFWQKFAICRSLSLDENNNSMWELIARLNRVRNSLSHSLEEASRVGAMDVLRESYIQQCGGMLEEPEDTDDALLLACVISLCLGFLDSFEQEIERYRRHVHMLDRIVNPHRHNKPDIDPV